MVSSFISDKDGNKSKDKNSTDFGQAILPIIIMP